MLPLRVRLIRWLSLVVSVAVAALGVGAVSASADSWTVEEGTHYLKGSGGEVLKSWTAPEWQTWRKQVQALSECMGVATKCAAKELAGETPLEDVPKLTAEAAQRVVESERTSQGGPLNEVGEALDHLGVDAATLPSSLGDEAVEQANIVSRRIGIELGNGLDELFEQPNASPLTRSELEAIEKHGESLDSPDFSFTQETTECPDGLASCKYGNVTLPPGYYLQTGFEAIRRIEYGEDQCGSGCKPYYRETPTKAETYIPHGFLGYSEFERTITSEENIDIEGYRSSHLVFVYAWKPFSQCGAPPPGLECKPAGIPAPGLITSEIEDDNVDAGLPATPKASAVGLPTTPPSTVNEPDLKEISENTHVREELEYKFGEKGPQEQELAQKELETLGAGSESEPDRLGCVHQGKPVNCATGNEYQTQTDLSVGGRGPALELALTYNSKLASEPGATAGPFGYGWTGSYSAHLEVGYKRSQVIVHQDNGSTVTFWLGSEGWQPIGGAVVQGTLTEEGEGYVYTLPDQTVLHFGSDGLLTSEVDRNGNSLTMSRNSEGRLEAIKDAAGREITLKYHEGRVESATDPMGHTVKYTYEGGNLASVTLPGETSPRWQYKYNSSHELTSETDGRGYTTTTEFNSGGQAISQTEPLGRTRKWSYAPTYYGSTTTLTEPNGSETVEKFNEDGSPIQITHAAGTSLATTTSDSYDSAQELLATTDADEHTTEYGYNAAGDRTSELNPDGDETRWEYDRSHDVVAVTEPDGEKTTIERDSHGNAIKVSRPAPGETTQVTKYKYDADGDVESMIDPLGHEWKYEYDSYGDRKAETDPLGNKRTWEYNKDSQETETVSPRGHVSGAKESNFKTTIERDAQGRPTSVTNPLKDKTEYKYDADGDLTTLKDSEGNTTTYTYDEDDEPVKIEEPNKDTTETEYNSEGRVIAHTDGNKHKTKYERNQLGEITEEIDPLGRKTTKEYDRAGNLTSVTDAEKRTTSYEYDHVNRLSKISYSDGKTPTVEYKYNGDGDCTNIIDGTGETIDKYDQLDRLTEAKDGHGDTVKYEYNLANEPTTITYPNGKAVTRSYDNNGRLEKVTDWASNTTTFAYNPDSELASTNFPTSTGDSDTYEYDDADQMSEALMKKGTETLASLLYTRGKDGGVTKATSKGLPGEEKPAFSYDENSRLTKGAGTSYAYDAANNPTTIEKTTYSYDSADELEQSTLKKATVAIYGYNHEGQRTTTTPASGAPTSYGYDQAGNLTSVTRTLPAIEDSYAYNGEGLRASETISGTTNYLTWDTAELELPLILSNGTDSFIYGPNAMPIEQISSGGTVTYVHHDQQGSTRLLTGSTGAITGKCTYAAYGAPTCEGTATTPLGFDAQYTSTDTGLIYLRNRVYDPATAQFLSADPLKAISGEPYSYAGDNPVNKSDPTGLILGIPGTPSWEEVGEGVAGWGDKLTLGATKWARERLGDENVDTCSGAYEAGGGAGLATALLIPGDDDAAAAEEFGDLTEEERAQIQDVVNRAGRPIEVVGSAARGERGLGSDIDYTAPASSYPNLQPYENDLPGIDSHGILSGRGDPNDGPSIRFEPEGEW